MKLEEILKLLEPNHKGNTIMAESIQVKLPPEMTPMFDDIKEVRAASFEPTSNTAIVIDAVKAYHKSRVRK